MHEKTIKVGAATVELRLRDREFLGLGEIRINGMPVRDGAWPVCPRLETPEGWGFLNFELLAVEQRGDETVLRTRSEARLLPRQYRTDWYRQMVPTKLGSGPVTAELDWILKPQTLEIAGETYTGLSYRFHYRGGAAKIHRLTDWATFELGGRADGNLLIARSAFRPPEHALTKAGRYTSAEEYGPDRARPEWAFRQMMPRFGAQQCFDFLWRPEATLLLAYDRPAYINGLVHKEPGEDWLQVVDEHWFPLTGEVQPPAHWVLLHQAAAAEAVHQGRTRWMQCWQWSREHYGKAVGMPVTKPFLMCQIADYAIPHQPETGVKILQRVRDEILPKAAAFGFNAIYFEPWWECNASQPAPTVGCASGNASSVSVCAPYDYAFAKGWGGDALMKDVAAAGRRLGVKAMPWLATHLANRMPDSPLFKAHPEWRVIDYSGAPFDGDYGDLCSGDLNGPFGEYFFNQIRHFTEELGIEAWFFDSYSNLTEMPVNFADPLLRPQIEKVWEIQRYCLEHGVVWTIEADGPFGHGCLGMPLTPTGPGMCLADYAGERAYTLLDANHRFGYDSAKDGAFPADTYFRSLACGGPLCVSQMAPQATLWDWVTPELQGWLKAYRQVEAFMVRPRLLADDAGILWETPGSVTAGKVLWTFQPGVLELPEPVAATDVLTGATGARSRRIEFAARRIMVLK